MAGNKPLIKVDFMKINSFEQLFDSLLTEACLVEKLNLILLPKIIEKIHSPELKEGVETHFQKTQLQLERLEKICRKHPRAATLLTIEDVPIAQFFRYAEANLRDNPPSPLLDAAIIALLQQIEHWEIAIYGTLKEFAVRLEESEFKKIIAQTLKEELDADTLLNRLAKGGFFSEGINVHAQR